MTTTTMTEVTTDELVSKFTAALASVKEFPAGDFSDHLFNKVRLSSFLQSISGDIPAEKSFGNDIESTKLHGIDIGSILDAMAAQSLARAIAALDSSVDPFNFRDCVDNANAKGWFEDSIIRVAPLLLAEHISAEVHAADPSLPKVQDLRNDTRFVDTYHGRLKSKAFIQGAILSDVVRKDHRYSTNLIFMLAYFESKPQLDNVVANDDVWERKIGSVGTSWIVELIENLKHDVEPVAEHISQSFGPVFAYNHLERNSVYDKTKLQNDLFVTNNSLTKIVNDHPVVSASVKQIQAKLTTIGAGATSNWKAIQDHLWTGLNASTCKLQDVVRSHATHQTVSEKSEYGLGWSGITTTRTTGDKIANLIDRGSERYPKIFKRKAPTHSVDSPQQLTDVSSFPNNWCLVAGTLITTTDGNKPVEALQNGDTVVTLGALTDHGRPTEFGVVSDEARRVSAHKPRVYGINGSPAFFTANHVFHTTTGLRAVDPVTAGKSNPSVNIGEMRVGHVLFRLGHGMEYELVTIESLESEIKEDVEVVYDVHLSEGRSYHANGWLTSVDYPEVSPKQVAQALAALPPRDRLRMLYKFPELEELLSKHDAATLSEVLSREMELEVNRRTARSYKAGPPGVGRVAMLDINRTFQLFHFEGNTSEPLPNSISIHEGLVVIDGNNLLSQARIEQKSSSILWTRPLSSGRFEHGRVELESTGMTGRGAVVYTDKIQPDDLAGAESMKDAVRFRCFATAPSTMRDKGELGADVVQFAALRAAPTMAMDSTADVPGDMDFTFTLELDKDIMPPNLDPASVKQFARPVQFGNIDLKIELPNGPKGVKVLTVSVPHLNRLCEAINQATPEYRNAFIEGVKSQNPDVKENEFKEVGKIDTLYTSSVVQNEKGQLVANVRMIDASYLAEAADFSNDIAKKFTGALPKSDISVPVVFQELEVVIRNDFMSAQGSLFEWDDSAKGMLGARHFLRSSTLREEADAQNAKRAMNAEKAGGIVSSNPNVPISNPQTPPSNVAGNIDLSGQLDCESLLNLENYNEYNIHKITASLLQETLRYHMSEDDRKNFIPGKKNESLPLELRDKLPDDLKQWISTKYSKAYISFLIAQGANSFFTQQQSEKLWYWWQGSGPNTLKKTPQYARMNQIVAVHAMRQLYQKHLDPFIMAGGKYWADQLKEAYSSDIAKKGLLMSYSTMKNNGVNVVNKICNLMNALDPEGKQAKLFHGEFLDYGIKTKFFTSPYIGSADQLGKFLFDAMNQLVIMVLNKDESLDPDLREAIANDIEPLRKNKEASVKTQVDLMKDEMNYMATLVVNHCKSMSKRWSWKGVESMFQQIEGRIKESPTEYPKTFKAVRVCAFIGLITGALTLAATTYMHWDDLSTGQRGLAICSILQVVSSSMQALQTFKMNPLVEVQRIQPGGEGSSPLRQRRGGLLLELADGEGLRQNIRERQLLPENFSDVMSTSASSRRSSLSKESSEPLFDGIGPLPPLEGSRPKFNVGMALMKGLDILIGVGFLIFLSMEIKANYDSMSQVERILSISQAVIQGLIVLVDIATLGMEMAVSFGLVGLQSAAKALCALATMGAILGIIALAVMISLIIYEATRPKPQTEAEKFASANKGLVDALPDPPAIMLDYAANPPSVSRNQSQKVTVTITNNKKEAVTLQQVVFLFNAGADQALFQGGQTSKNDSSASSTTVGVKFQAKDSGAGIDMDLDGTPAPASTVCLSGNIHGKQVQAGQPFEHLTFKPGDWVSILFEGVVAEKGGDASITFVEYAYQKDSTTADSSKREVKINKT